MQVKYNILQGNNLHFSSLSDEDIDKRCGKVSINVKIEVYANFDSKKDEENAFSNADTNGDEKISMEEFRAIFTVPERKTIVEVVSLLEFMSECRHIVVPSRTRFNTINDHRIPCFICIFGSMTYFKRLPKVIKEIHPIPCT